MKVLLIDNYDSFTFNLYQHVGELLTHLFSDFSFDVKRNDEMTLDELKAYHYDRIIISPGPGNPADIAYFGISKDIILDAAQTTPTLGVCLGLQGIAHYYGGKVTRARLPMHGKISQITHDGKGIFKKVPQNIRVMRYHSLIADPASIPDCLEITAHALSDKGNEVMGIRHKHYPLEGVQFHPESFATEYGKKMLKNFLLGSN